MTIGASQHERCLFLKYQCCYTVPRTRINQLTVRRTHSFPKVTLDALHAICLWSAISLHIAVTADTWQHSLRIQESTHCGYMTALTADTWQQSLQIHESAHFGYIILTEDTWYRSMRTCYSTHIRWSLTLQQETNYYSAMYWYSVTQSHELRQ